MNMSILLIVFSKNTDDLIKEQAYLGSGSIYLGIIGLLIIAIICYLLFKTKAIPVVLFSTIPVIGAFLAGFNLEEVKRFITSGIGTVGTMAFLFVFSVTFFGIMSDAGMFDIIVNSLVKIAGNNVILIAIFTEIIAIFSHFDGATVTTVLVTIPAMLPLYKKLNIRPQLLLLLTAAGMGVMNLVSWGGPVVRVANVLGADPVEMWKKIIPLQIVGIVANLILAYIMAKREIKYHGAGVIQENVSFLDEDIKENSDKTNLKRPKLVWFNLILTCVILGLLMWNELPHYYVFMVGCSIALLVNYPSYKMQRDRVKAHAGAAVDVASVILAAGIMVGVLNESGMLSAMVRPVLTILPELIARHLHILAGIMSLPIGLFIGTDAYFYGIVPIVIEIAKNAGVSPENTGITMLIGKNLSLMLSPLVPATFLAIGLAGVELKEHIKYSIVPLWIISILMLAFALLLNIIQF